MKERYRTTSTILLFHRVAPYRDEMWDPMDPALFNECIAYASKKFNIVPLSELLLHTGIKSRKPLAAITFDDGYRDYLEYAAPIMKKYGVPSTLFVITDSAETNTPPWTYSMDFLFKNTRHLKLENLHFTNQDSEFGHMSWSSHAARIDYGRKLKQRLKAVPATVRRNVIDSIRQSFSDVTRPTGMMLNWEEIRQLSSSNTEIGSHTISHQTLATIEDETELREEIATSYTLLQEKIGKVSPVLSYPCGSYDDRVKNMARSAGYAAALAVEGKVYDSQVHDRFAIPRVELYNESVMKTKLRMNGVISRLSQLLKR